MSSERNALFEHYLTKHFAHVSDQKRYRGRKVAYYQHNYVRLLPARRDACMLDIGPGYGEMLELLLSRGYTNIHAVDLSPEVADFCNTIVPGSTVPVCDTTAHLQSQTGSFDCITMFHILEHVPKSDVIPLLRAAYNALRPQGQLIIEVPNMANPVIGLNVRYADFTHEVGFTELSLRYALETAGFAEVVLFETKLSPDRWQRSAQYIIQKIFCGAIRLIYRAYGQVAPRLLGRAISAVAKH